MVGTVLGGFWGISRPWADRTRRPTLAPPSRPQAQEPLGCLLEADEGTPRSALRYGWVSSRSGWAAPTGAEAVEEGGCDLLWRLLLGSRVPSGPAPAEEADWASGLVL